MSQKSYNNTATLYLIPTPIGNMEDITLRAIKILGEVAVVFSEDTRVTAQLLNHLEIKKKLIANHEHNEITNKNKIITYLKNGENVGLVTDRGTPVISDPGYELARFVIAEGYNVVSLPGATALIPALTMSGLTPMPFIFYGFLSNKETKRKNELENLKKEKATIIFYESPHRLTKTLENILEILGNRSISISREISKKFEEVYRDTVSNIIEQTKNVKGEIVIVIEGNKEDISYDELTIIQHVNLYIKEGYKDMEAIKIVAKERKISKNEVYNEYHNIKKGVII